MIKRYLLRLESGIAEPHENPMRAILMDRKQGHYNLLNKEQTDIVLSAISKNPEEPKILKAKKPFKIYVELSTLKNNAKIVNLSSKRKDILSAPISAYFEISNKCNLKCLGCYQGERKDNKPSLTLKEILKFLNDFAHIGD